MSDLGIEVRQLAHAAASSGPSEARYLRGDGSADAMSEQSSGQRTDGETPDVDVDPADLIDAEEVDTSLVRSIHLRQLAQPGVVAHVVGITIGLLVLAWPQRSLLVAGRLTGLLLVVVALVGLVDAIRSRPRSWIAIVALLATLGVGVGLTASPTRTELVLGRVLGSLLIAIGAVEIVGLMWGHGRDDRNWRFARAVLLIAAGGLLIAFPTTLVEFAIILLATSWILLGSLVVFLAVTEPREQIPTYGDASRLAWTWLLDRPKTADDRSTLYEKIFYEPPHRKSRVTRFVTLMLLASAISSLGVVADSTAVVIGAMLIAPLMTPLMGMAVALTMGWPNRLLNTAIIALGGIVIAIVVGLLIGLTEPIIFDTTSNSQIVSRSSPTLIDLMIACAAGAAGAYGLSRPDVSDALPGVAVAIALVPPLTVVGVSWSQGDWESGIGALLLYVTNMVAILAIGGVTFVVTGVTPVRQVADNQHRVRTWLAAIGGAAAIALGGLLLNGAETTTNALNDRAADEAVREWLEDHPSHRAVDVTVDGDVVTAIVIGPSTDRPGAEELAVLLTEEFDRKIIADVRLVVEEREVSGG